LTNEVREQLTLSDERVCMSLGHSTRGNQSRWSIRDWGGREAGSELSNA
jgi:hypothetical protein